MINLKNKFFKMDNIYLFKLCVSFFIGAIWITLITIFSEKFGSKIGGIIASIPATIVVSLFFISITQTKSFAVNSINMIPIMLGINIIMVLVYIYFARISFNLGLFISIAFWFLASFIIYINKINDFYLSILIYFCILIISYFILKYFFEIKSIRSKILIYTNKEIFFRAFFGGGIVFFAVIMSKIGGPLIGGIFAPFPALTISLMVITHKNHGIKFTESLLKNFILTGTINVLIYVISLKILYNYFNVYLSTIFAVIISFIFTYLFYIISKRN